MIARTTALAGIVLTGVVLVSPPAEARGARVLFEHGKLTVVGTNADNSVLITRKGRAVRVKVDGKRIRTSKPIKPRRLKQITVQGRGGNDTVRLVENAGPLPRAELNGGAGNDQLTGGSGPTTLIGGPGSDGLTGGPGVTTMVGGDGDDVLVAGSGPTTMDAGGGNDTADGGTGSATVTLGPGDDSFHGGSGPVVVDGGVGRDNLGAGLSVSAQLSGSADEDILVGGPGTADLRGEGAADTLTAGSGPTVLSGGDGPDQLWAGARTSQVAGELGDDAYRIDPSVVQGPLRLVEASGQGHDLLDLQGGSAPLELDLRATGPQQLTSALSVELSSAAGFEDVVGGAGDDAFTGNAWPNTFTGLGGQDTFRFGEALGGGGQEAFGADTVTDFGNGVDAVDLFTGLSVHSGLGTTTVTVWDGVSDLGTITATNGHLWQAGDFS